MEKSGIIAIIIWSVLAVIGTVSFLTLLISSKKNEKEKKNAKHNAKKK